MSTAKCPKCEKTVSHLEVQDLPAHHRTRRNMEGIVYCCPSCHTILAAAIDPVLLSNQIIQAVKTRG